MHKQGSTTLFILSVNIRTMAKESFDDARVAVLASNYKRRVTELIASFHGAAVRSSVTYMEGRKMCALTCLKRKVVGMANTTVV